jgi:hypothetical protein
VGIPRLDGTSIVGLSDMLVHEFSIVASADTFEHAHVARVERIAMNSPFAKVIVLDLSHAHDATTAAFADLILLRRRLLDEGRDLRLCGLHDRSEKVTHVNRLSDVLPLR